MSGPSIDWMYARKHCGGCQKAREYLDDADATVVETVDATKIRYGRDEVIALARTTQHVVTGRGQKIVDLDPNATADDDLAAHLLGPSGNLKAPTLRLGTTLLVGFNQAMYDQYLSKSRP